VSAAAVVSVAAGASGATSSTAGASSTAGVSSTLFSLQDVATNAAAAKNTKNAFFILIKILIFYNLITQT
jgi:hypothetical protein